jgi:glucose/arabinose dehydrogenase
LADGWCSTAKALFIGLGENNQRPTAQDLDKLQGKVVRLTEGKSPAG